MLFSADAMTSLYFDDSLNTPYWTLSGLSPSLAEVPMTCAQHPESQTQAPEIQFCSVSQPGPRRDLL